MVKVDNAGMAGREAAEFLSEGNPNKAIAILESDMEISRELREMLAAMLKGFGPNNTTLIIKGAGGRIRKSHINFKRDFDLYLEVENEIEKSGCGIEEACKRLSGNSMLGSEAIRRAYQKMNRAFEEYSQISNDAIQSVKDSTRQ